MIKTVLAFGAGIAIGAFVNNYIWKTKFNETVDAELKEMRELRKKEAKKEKEPEEKPEEEKYEFIENYKKAINNYTKPSSTTKGEDKPYVISPDEFGELDGYKQVTLVYYEDKVLADEYDVIVQDVEGMVGTASLETFGQYEDDSVFVRNDKRKTDYEILASERTFLDSVKSNDDSSEDWDRC